MTVLDYFVLSVLLASVIAGAAKGIIKGAVSLIFAVLVLFAAVRFYETAANLVAWATPGERAAQLVGFLAVFTLVLAVGAGVSFALRKTLRRASLSWVDHAFGAGFGALRGWLVCSAVYLALTAFPIRPEAVTQATLAPVLLQGARVIAYLTSPEMRQKFTTGYETAQEIWKRSQQQGWGHESRGEAGNEKQARSPGDGNGREGNTI